MHTHQRCGTLQVFGPEPRVAFTGLDFVGDDGECKTLNARERIFTGCSIGEHTGKLGHARDPATVGLAVELHGEIHGGTIAREALRLGHPRTRACAPAPAAQ